MLSFCYIFLGSLLSISPYLRKDFLNMDGELITHHEVDKEITIYELRATTGLTRWYGQEVFTEVCMSKECKQVHIWLFWNGLGDYLGFQLEGDDQLTKKDHEPFTKNDYKQLDQILADKGSYFRYMELTDLIANQDSARQVDAYSGATKSFLTAYSVEGAVYTCFTLWRIVHGTVRERIRALFRQRIDNSYLEQLFASSDPPLLAQAIDLLIAYPSYQRTFAAEIIVVIEKCPDEGLALKALGNIEDDLLGDGKFQRQLVADIGATSSSMRAEIIWKLSTAKKVDASVVSKLLDSFLSGEIEVNELRLIYLMINDEMMADRQIHEQVTVLERHENAYVRKISAALLAGVGN